MRPTERRSPRLRIKGRCGCRARSPSYGPACFRWYGRRRPDDGLGIILLNSNADTHFSFTNALGLVSADEMRGVEIACSQFPSARWLIGLHHHTSEYPRPVKQLSERIGTALINGTWFVRRLQQIAPGAVVMHGHRHIDWIGECGGLRIVSAPSPVMNMTDDRTTYFYIHTLARGSQSPAS